MTFTPQELREIRQNLKKNKWRGKKEAREYEEFVIQQKKGNFNIKDLIKQVLNKGEENERNQI